MARKAQNKKPNLLRQHMMGTVFGDFAGDKGMSFENVLNPSKLVALNHA